ncbi:SMEK domain-containing protein [Myxococcota bacterium]|nr:SMEK domain-containing protein [Myxococcota bacterium]MBU1537652.1 SMEK domain-containing protein [Myxococcota bacterium]
MKRSLYFDIIDEKLSTLAVRIENRGRLNILDLHLHSESFYQHFFNMLFGWELENLNTIKANATAIDLIDQTNRIIIQVSATNTKDKVESALSKDLSAYAGYAFKFISIAKDASALRRMTFANPHNLTFAPKTDIYDIASILKIIEALSIDDLRLIAEFIKKELGEAFEPQKLDSNLAAIINILAQEDWRQNASAVETTPFEIEQKIDSNNLDNSAVIIDDYKIHYGRLDTIYSEFDREGANKSTSVLEAIRHDYLINMDRLSGDALFFEVIECVADRVQKSANYKAIPYEELELSVKILVVDSFIRCKIFKNPVGTTNAAS